MPFTYADDPYLAYLQATQMSNLSAQGLEGVNPAYRQMMMDRLSSEYSGGGPGAVDVNAPQVFPGLVQPRGPGYGGTGSGNQFSGLQDALGYLSKAKQVSQLSGKLGGPDPYGGITDALKDWLGLGTPASEAAPVGMSAGATALPGTEALTTSAPEILQGAGLAGYGSGLGAESAAAEAALAAEYGGGTGAEAGLGAAGAGVGGLGLLALPAAMGIMGFMANQGNIKERKAQLAGMQAIENAFAQKPEQYYKILQQGLEDLTTKYAGQSFPQGMDIEQWMKGTPAEGYRGLGLDTFLQDIERSPINYLGAGHQNIGDLAKLTMGMYGSHELMQPGESR